jgi:hypothetical protein
MIETIKVLETRKIAFQSGYTTPFEVSFLRTITRDENIYNKSENYINIIDYSSLKKYCQMTSKQKKVYLNIEFKYNEKSEKGDIYSKYKEIFKEKNIELDSFDTRHLETFKGVFNESENFKKWFSQIYTT